MGHFHALLPFIHVEKQGNSMVSRGVFHSVKCEGAEEGGGGCFPFFRYVKKLKCTALSKKAAENRESNMLI